MINPIVGDLGNDAKLRYVVEQLNRRFQQMNLKEDDDESRLDALELTQVYMAKIIVNTDGDVLTNSNGEVLFAS